MALNLANDDDGGSQMEVAQKDSAESYPGTEGTFLLCCHCLFVWFPVKKISKPLYMYKECAPVERFLKHTSQQTVIEKYTCLNFSSEQETLQLCERDREIEKEQRGKKVGKVLGDQKN